MRMWNINPKLLCGSHLLGEHFEIHCMIGDIRKGGLWTKRLTYSGYLEPQNAKKRHDELVAEMERRGYNHRSPLNVDGLYYQMPNGKVNKNKSIFDLWERCDACRYKIKMAGYYVGDFE